MNSNLILLIQEIINLTIIKMNVNLILLIQEIINLK